MHHEVPPFRAERHPRTGATARPLNRRPCDKTDSPRGAKQSLPIGYDCGRTPARRHPLVLEAKHWREFSVENDAMCLFHDWQIRSVHAPMNRMDDRGDVHSELQSPREN